MKYNVALVGCGNIAGGYDLTSQNQKFPLTHAAAFANHPEFNLLACCDPNKSKRNSFKAKWDFTYAVADIEQLKNIDATFHVVCICSPTHLHALHLEEALFLNPKLLFCEKPVTSDLRSTRDLINRYAKKNIPLVVNYTRRWDPEVRSLRREFASLKWGKVFSVSGLYNKGILNNGSHMLDLIRFLLGDLILLSIGRAVYDFWKDDPSVPALLETKKGVPITLNIADAKYYSIFEIQFVTEFGVVRIEDGGLSWTIRKIVDSEDFPGYCKLGDIIQKNGGYRVSMTQAVTNIYQILTKYGYTDSDYYSALETSILCDDITKLVKQNKIT
tara:strand:+ start:790 stop:1776 length:987 start_codon:yes stop_codon:yes gene_type:complete